MITCVRCVPVVAAVEQQIRENLDFRNGGDRRHAAAANEQRKNQLESGNEDDEAAVGERETLQEDAHDTDEDVFFVCLFCLFFLFFFFSLSKSACVLIPVSFSFLFFFFSKKRNKRISADSKASNKRKKNDFERFSSFF